MDLLWYLFSLHITVPLTSPRPMKPRVAYNSNFEPSRPFSLAPGGKTEGMPVGAYVLVGAGIGRLLGFGVLVGTEVIVGTGDRVGSGVGESEGDTAASASSTKPGSAQRWLLCVASPRELPAA